MTKRPPRELWPPIPIRQATPLFDKLWKIPLERKLKTLFAVSPCKNLWKGISAIRHIANWHYTLYVAVFLHDILISYYIYKRLYDKLYQRSFIFWRKLKHTGSWSRRVQPKCLCFTKKFCEIYFFLASCRKCLYPCSSPVPGTNQC